MGKTHEALEWAEKEYQLNRQETAPGPLPPGRARPPQQARTASDMDRYENLRTNLLARHPDGSIKTILFAGAAHGDGASTTAVNFAAGLARGSQLKVLLIDMNLRTPSLHDVFKIDPVPGLSDFVGKNGRVAPITACEAPMKVGPGELYVIPCGGPRSEPVPLLQSNGFNLFLKKMRDSYDYVVLDAPPVHGFAESRVLCAMVDGVVLVIQAGRTRRQVALSAKKQLEEAGGKLLGVVVNRRRYYIPEFIYRRL